MAVDLMPMLALLLGAAGFGGRPDAHARVSLPAAGYGVRLDADARVSPGVP